MLIYTHSPEILRGFHILLFQTDNLFKNICSKYTFRKLCNCRFLFLSFEDILTSMGPWYCSAWNSGEKSKYLTRNIYKFKQNMRDTIWNVDPSNELLETTNCWRLNFMLQISDQLQIRSWNGVTCKCSTEGVHCQTSKMRGVLWDPPKMFERFPNRSLQGGIEHDSLYYSD